MVPKGSSYLPLSTVPFQPLLLLCSFVEAHPLPSSFRSLSDKYTTFSRKDKHYRKWMHKVPHFTKVRPGLLLLIFLVRSTEEGGGKGREGTKLTFDPVRFCRSPSVRTPRDTRGGEDTYWTGLGCWSFFVGGQPTGLDLRFVSRSLRGRGKERRRTEDKTGEGELTVRERVEACGGVFLEWRSGGEYARLEE